MAREIVERFICDRSGEIEIRPAGTTLDNMNEDGEARPDFYARLVLPDGEVEEIVFDDLSSGSKDEIEALLRKIETPSKKGKKKAKAKAKAAPAVEAEAASAPSLDGTVEDVEDPAPPAEDKPKRARRTMLQITSERLSEFPGMTEDFWSLSDKDQKEYLKKDKASRQGGGPPPPILVLAPPAIKDDDDGDLLDDLVEPEEESESAFF
jgi:hypothetical protein